VTGQGRCQPANASANDQCFHASRAIPALSSFSDSYIGKYHFTGNSPAIMLHPQPRQVTPPRVPVPR
jgi:hypothetical protein